MDKIPELLKADVESIESSDIRELVTFALVTAREGLQDGLASQSRLVDRVSDAVGRKLTEVISRNGEPD